MFVIVRLLHCRFPRRLRPVNILLREVSWSEVNVSVLHSVLFNLGLLNYSQINMRSFPQPIRMEYVVNFTSMQYMSTSVDTGAEGTLSTIVSVASSLDVDYSRLRQRKS